MCLSPLLGDVVDEQHLRSFLVLAEELNFHRAAHRLFVSQPTLSGRIRQLEADLGVRLFVRDRSGTRLTEDGASALAEASRAVESFQTLRNRGHRLRSLVIGILNGGADDGCWSLVRALHERHPDATVSLRHVGFLQALPWLEDGRIDALYAVGPFGETDGQVTDLHHIAIQAIMAAHHPAAREEVVPLDWLAPRATACPPPQMGSNWARFWTAQEYGGPPAHRLVVSVQPTLPGLGRAILRGGVGLWPSSVPSLPGTAVRELDHAVTVPVQLVTRHRPGSLVAELVRLAEGLSTRRSSDPYVR